MKAPYKGQYALDQVWPEILNSRMWRDFANANHGEAMRLNDIASKKIASTGSYSVASDITNTHFGDAMLMMILTLPAQTP